MLLIVMTLKEYRSMLLGAEIIIHTDHKNLTFENLNTQRVLRWRLYVEEYSPTMEHVPGPENALADAYSRMPYEDLEDEKGKNSIVEPVTKTSHFYSPFESQDMFDCFLNLPVPPTQNNPLNLAWVKERQDNDAALVLLRQGLPANYIIKQFGNNVDLVCYVRPGDNPDTQWKICLTQDSLIPTIYWFHQVQA